MTAKEFLMSKNITDVNTLRIYSGNGYLYIHDLLTEYRELYSSDKDCKGCSFEFNPSMRCDACSRSYYDNYERS